MCIFVSLDQAVKRKTEIKMEGRMEGKKKGMNTSSLNLSS